MIPLTRIERAARANAKAYGDDWDAVSETVQNAYRRIATVVIEAACPGLIADPPTAWLAPWEANAVVDHWLIPEDWEKLRDAHLKEHP